MKTATVRELRYEFAKVSRCIAEGETVEITKMGLPFAHLIPAAAGKPEVVRMPDFMARLREHFPHEQADPTGTIQSILDYDRGDR